jgi:hypothetical protein
MACSYQLLIVVHSHVYKKILVLGIRYAVELQAWVVRVLLQIEGCDLDGFLLVGGQPCEAVDEGVGDAKLHMFCAYAATRAGSSSMAKGATN